MTFIPNGLIHVAFRASTESVHSREQYQRKKKSNFDHNNIFDKIQAESFIYKQISGTDVIIVTVIIHTVHVSCMFF